MTLLFCLKLFLPFTCIFIAQAPTKIFASPQCADQTGSPCDSSGNCPNGLQCDSNICSCPKYRVFSTIKCKCMIKDKAFGCSKSGDCIDYAHCHHANEHSSPNENRCDCCVGPASGGRCLYSKICSKKCSANQIFSDTKNRCLSQPGGSCEKSGDCVDGARCFHPNGNKNGRCDCCDRKPIKENGGTCRPDACTSSSIISTSSKSLSISLIILLPYGFL